MPGTRIGLTRVAALTLLVVTASACGGGSHTTDHASAVNASDAATTTTAAAPRTTVKKHAAVKTAPTTTPPTTAAPVTTVPVTVAPATTTTTTVAVCLPVHYDPTQPINLCGTPGVTPAEEMRATGLLIDTLRDLPHYASTTTAYNDGYRTIGDSDTGFEHYIKWSLVNDTSMLDTAHPESLVYKVDGSARTLVAAMFMMPEHSRFTDIPDVGGALTQWHVHRDLCFKQNPSDSLQWLVQGQTDSNGDCPAGQTQKGNEPMMHVWIVKNACGPFAGLTGEPGGQIAPGEQRLCDKLHGSV